METKELFQLRRIDWRWIIVSYCFLVLFHLFPSFLTADFLFANDEPIALLLWLGIGIGVVCAVIAYQSRKITILEPGLAAVLYAFTIVGQARIPWKYNIQWKYNSDFRFVALQILVLMAAFIVGCVGAAFGEWLQMRKERRRPSEGSLDPS